MEDIGIGRLITEPRKRDAVHIACIPATAKHELQPGEHVAVDGGWAFESREPLGVVDPFLKAPVQAGDKCWVMLYPGTIQSLRHEWTHPALDGSPEQMAARAWIEAFATRHDEAYNAIMAAAANWVEHGDWYLGAGIDDGDGDKYYGKFEGESVPAEFWRHYQIATGAIVPEEKQDNFFTCSC